MEDISGDIRQHRTMGAAGFGGSFAPIVQYEKWEIHPVFPHFPYFRSGQNLSSNLLAPLCGVAINYSDIYYAVKNPILQLRNLLKIRKSYAIL